MKDLTNRQVSLSDFLMGVMLLLVFLTFFTKFSTESLATFGLFVQGSLMALVIVFSFLLFTKIDITYPQIKVFAPAVAFILFYFFSYMLQGFEKYALYNLIRIITFVAFAFLLTNLTWRSQWFKLMAVVSAVAFITLYMMIGKGLVNPNQIGGYAYFLWFFPIIYYYFYREKHKKKLFWMMSLLVLAVIWFSEARTIFLCLAFGLLTFISWKQICKNKLFFNLYFFAVLAFNYFIVVIYPRLDVILDNFAYYNYLSIKYTGEALVSGRVFLWKGLSEVIMMKPYFGYGAGKFPENFIDTELSAHNWYLQISLQVGILGLSTMLLFLYLIWRTFWINRYNRKVMIVACFFISILIYQSFEVALTQNNFSLAIIQWMIIALGLNFCFHEKWNKIMARQ
jgi:O-antigen ligase